MRAAPIQRSFVRLSAIRALLLGHPRSTVCQLYCRTDRMVRLWVTLFNASGIDALIRKPSSGRPRSIGIEKLEDLLIPVLKDPSSAGQWHWTGVKVQGWLTEKFQTEVSYRTTIGYLHELDFNHRFPRRWPERPEHKQEAREAARIQFGTDLKNWSADSTIKLWFSDETGVEGDPIPRQRWVQPGSKATLAYRGKHIRQNVVGAVRPDTGELCALIFDGVDSLVFQRFVDELALTSPQTEGQRQLVMDNASWHRTKSMNWHHFEPTYLPSYSPDFNPIERLWLRMKADWFTDWTAKSKAQLTDRLCHALNSFINDPHKTASNTAFRK
jgi:transposase